MLKYDPYSRTNHCLIDALIAGLAFSLAYQIRFDATVPAASSHQMWLFLMPLMAGRVAVNWIFGIYSFVWRYTSIRDAMQLAKACGALSLVLLGVRLGAPPSLQILRIPVSIIILELLVTLLGVLSVRSLRRLCYEHRSREFHKGASKRRLLLLGAGSAGIMVAKEALLSSDVELLGFLDDDPRKAGKVISGVRVLGPMDALPRVTLEKSPDEVVICIAAGSSEVYRKILRLCKGLSIRTRIVPELSEILEGKIRITSFRDVDLNELLGRETTVTPVSKARMGGYYHGRRILIAGAGGSIGSELAGQLTACEPELLLLLDKDENGLFELHKRLCGSGYPGRRQLLVADLRAKGQMANILKLYHPEIIFDAAAHKHVPMMESNAAEAVFNNVFGTKNLFELAARYGTERLVFISSDKAVGPVNIMGATKRIGELLARSGEEGTTFTCVRFGNVLGSRGSVIPLFREQIARGGPLTITDPEMRRYFMTIPEAVHLILTVGQMDENGSLFVLDMGDPRSVVELARDLVETSGLRLGQDIQMIVTGTRPGEKLTESLCSEDESLVPTPYEGILEVESPSPSRDQVGTCLEKLWNAAVVGDELAIRLAFREVGIQLPGQPIGELTPPAYATPLYQTL